MSGRVGSITTPIITDGLVFNLDAANRASYPKTGTIWNDTINGNNGTLTNGPTFDSANGGSIVFDGLDDYLNIPLSTTIINSFTWEFIFKKVSGNILLIITRGLSNKGVWMSISSTDNVTFTIGSVADYSYNTNFIENEIYTLTNVINNTIWTSYINGLLVNQMSISPSRTQNQTNRWVSSAILSTNNTLITFLQQTMYSYRYYNRALSSSEILHNYNALKGRFGL